MDCTHHLMIRIIQMIQFNLLDNATVYKASLKALQTFSMKIRKIITEYICELMLYYKIYNFEITL